VGAIYNDQGLGVPVTAIAMGALLLVFGTWFIEHLRHINEQGNRVERLYARFLRNWQGYLSGILFVGIGGHLYATWMQCSGSSILTGARIAFHVIGWCLVAGAVVVASVGRARVAEAERLAAAESTASGDGPNSAGAETATISWRPRAKVVIAAGFVAAAGVITILASGS